jgi:hypothetical protein
MTDSQSKKSPGADKKPRLSPSEVVLRTAKTSPLPGESVLKWAKPVLPAKLPKSKKFKRKLPTREQVVEILDEYESAASRRRSDRVLQDLAKFLTEKWAQDQVWLHEQTRAYRSLLASVVSTAVLDACIPPIVEETGKKRVVRGMDVDAFTAMRFLFDTNVSGLDVYASWLDFDAGQFRHKLLELMNNKQAGPLRGYSAQQRMNFCRNYRLWQQMPNDYEPQEREEADD